MTEAVRGAGTGLPGTVVVAATPAAVAEAAASWLVGESAAAARRGIFHVALAGGSTPGDLFDILAAEPARSRVDWSTWEVWFGDERAVDPGDERSNWWLAHQHLLRHVAVPADRIHRIEAERPDLAAAAADYAALLERRCPHGANGAPRLDCILLGLGENGHTASLFPGDPALAVTSTWATPARADYEPRDRITLTFPVLDAAAAVALTVTGAAKGPALRGVVAGSVPAAQVRPVAGELRWFLDEAAAQALAG